MLHIGIGIVFRACGGICSLAIVGQELKFLHSLTILSMTLAIEHETFGDIVITLFHQGHLYLILNFLDSDAVMYVKMCDDIRQTSEVYIFVYRLERLDDGIHNLVERKTFCITVSLGDCQ